MARNPFGLEMGMSQQQLSEFIDQTRKSDKGWFDLTSVPSPHPYFVSHAARIAPKSGLFMLVARGKRIYSAASGTDLKLEFDSMRQRVSNIYGPHELTNELPADSIWSEPHEWMQSLAVDDRVLTADWDRDNKSKLPSTILSVVLSAEAYDEESGYLSLTYYFGNFLKGHEELR